jgi:UDP-galactose transporter B1
MHFKRAFFRSLVTQMTFIFRSSVQCGVRAGVVAFTYAQLRLDYLSLQLFKAAKPIAILCSQIVLNWRLPNLRKVFVVVLISIGLAVFRLGGRFSTFSAFSTVAAFVGLFCEAIYVPIVDRLKVGAGGPYVLMLYAQLWSLLLFAVLCAGELLDAARWIVAHPTFATKLLVFGCSGAVGQLALFTAVALTDGLLVSVATTLRKIFTILISAVVYHHRLKSTEWAGIAIVFSALGIEAVSKKRKPHKNNK